MNVYQHLNWKDIVFRAEHIFLSCRKLTVMRVCRMLYYHNHVMLLNFPPHLVQHIPFVFLKSIELQRANRLFQYFVGCSALTTMLNAYCFW